MLRRGRTVGLALLGVVSFIYVYPVPADASGSAAIFFVPNVIGDWVTQVLQTFEFKFREMYPIFVSTGSDGSSGFVVKEDPAAGSGVTTQSSVTLEVSGLQQNKRVPRVVGLSQRRAKADLEHLGYTVDISPINGIPQIRRPFRNEVLLQSVKPSTLAAKDSVILISVCTSLCARY